MRGYNVWLRGLEKPGSGNLEEVGSLLQTRSGKGKREHREGHVVVKDGERGWRDGSAVKSTDCTSRGPEFNSQQPQWWLTVICNGI